MELTSGAIYNLAKSIESLHEIIFKLGWAFFFIFLVFTAGFWWAIITYKSINADKSDEFYPHKASKYFESGNIDALFEYCEKYFNRYPNNIWINWYYAIGHYNKGEFEVAQKFFLAVSKLNPSWETEVEPYLNKIEKTTTIDKSH